MKVTFGIGLILAYYLILVLGDANEQMTGFLVTFVLLVYCAYEAVKNRYHNIIIVSIIFSIIGLEVEVISILPKFRIEDFIGFTIIPLIFLLDPTFEWQRFLKNRMVRLILAFAIISVVSPVMSYLVGLSTVSLRDFTPLFIQMKWLFLILLIFKSKWSSQKIDNFTLIVLFAFLTSALVGIGQAFEIGPIEELTKSYWARGWHYVQTGEHGRQTGTSAGPAQYGGLLLMGTAISLSYFFFSLKKKKIFAYIVFNALVLAAFASGSRTSIAALGVMIAVQVILVWRHLPLGSKLINLLILFYSVRFLYSNFFFISDYMSDFYAVMINPMSDGSFANRWDYGYNRAIELFLQSPVWGWGPNKATYLGASHSEYHYLASRYGLLGLIWMMSYFWYFLKIGNILKNSANSDQMQRIFGYAAISIVIGLAFFAVNGSILFIIQLPNIYMTLLAMTSMLYFYFEAAQARSRLGN